MGKNVNLTVMQNNIIKRRSEGMSVNSYLQDLGSSLVLSSNEKSSITTSIDTLKSRLASYFGDDVTDKIIFGSYWCSFWEQLGDTQRCGETQGCKI